MQEEAKVGSNPVTETNPGVSKKPFDWRVVLIALYLFSLLLVSVNWLSGLMMANTSGLDDKGNKIVGCNANLGSGCTPSPTPTPSGNGNNNIGTNTTPPPISTPNTNAPAPSNTTNTNRAANANTNIRPVANSNSNSQGAPPIDPKSPVNAGNTNANSGKTVSRPSDIADYVVIENPGIFGSWLSVCAVCENGCISGDGFLFLLVLVAGMIGAIIRSSAYLVYFVSKGEFAINYAWYYLFQPFFGAGLALIFYVVLRGGFGSSTIGKNNLYAFAAVAFLSGLFTENVMAKLKLIAESILVSTEKPKPPKQDGGAPPPAQPPVFRGGDGAGVSPPATGTPPRNIGKDEPPV